MKKKVKMMMMILFIMMMKLPVVGILVKKVLVMYHQHLPVVWMMIY